MNPFISADALVDLEQYLGAFPTATDTAMRIAINDTARGKAIKLSRDEMYKQVNFPAGYLNKDRLEVSRLASNNSLEAVITGRDRPTSLARFANAKPGQKGVAVQVHKGSVKIMKRAFIVKLRSGRQLDGETFNQGLAIRLAPGEKIMNRHGVTSAKLSENVYLLYGPSVDQVFAAVATEVSPKVADEVTTQFFRQLSRLTDG